MRAEIKHRSAMYPGNWREPTADDEDFEDELPEYVDGVIGQFFYTTVAGVTFPNRDGLSRSTVIGRCRRGETLSLVPDNAIPGHADAFGVHRADGAQLGYLPAGMGAELVKDVGVYGGAWTAVFRKRTRDPETKKYVGALLCIVNLTSSK